LVRLSALRSPHSEGDNKARRCSAASFAGPMARACDIRQRERPFRALHLRLGWLAVTQQIPRRSGDVENGCFTPA
jgi:hypothetical protein